MPAAKIRSVRYIIRMVLRRTSHAVYDTLYHLVWSPKYRRDVLQGDIVKQFYVDCPSSKEYRSGLSTWRTIQKLFDYIQQRVRELFTDIAEQ